MLVYLNVGYVNLDHLPKVLSGSVRFLHYEVSSFSFAINKCLWGDILRLCKYSVSRQILPPLPSVLISISRSCWQQLIIVAFP